ncbi:hypothetical protein ABEB36_002565 [Hypothenemus hampei]|uniref:Uncharacterized protein n=1 Tax=Hypothenemus hampei TaxID=57062 RepID=A0ABD1F6A9_HYPHA
MSTVAINMSAYTINVKEKNPIPVYKKELPKERKVKNPEDIYEFTDLSPKVKKRNQRQNRSSILFDKNTYEILKKIEYKEAKMKRKRPLNKKTYNEIVEDVLSKVKKKIVNKQLPEVVCKGAINAEEQKMSISEDILPLDTRNRKILPTLIQHTDTKLQLDVRDPKINTSSKNEQHQQVTFSQTPNNIHQNDISSCFGFDKPIPAESTPIKKTSVHILSNILLRKNNLITESPINFNAQNPKANSTMTQDNSSPWRSDSLLKRNPHFLSLKQNALPRIDQEPVLEYSLVESMPVKSTKVTSTPQKKHVQTSILDFISSNIDHENLTQGSLYDCEAFNSPTKKDNTIISSTKVKRTILSDLNHSLEKHNREEMSYFGFDESPSENKENSGEILCAKPSRFDIGQLKKYTRKNKREDEVNLYSLKDNSISIIEEEDDSLKDIRLFEEPEEMLDDMAPVEINLKKSKRKRLYSSDYQANEDERKKIIKKAKVNIFSV